MQALPGTYALIFSASQKAQITIGRIGTLHLEPGFYIYVGSAFGPGGLKARIAHHCRKPTRPHWHIDFLTPAIMLKEIWHTCDPAHREHQWAAALSGIRGASVPLAGFGSSDCRCQSHLFYFRSKPGNKNFRRKIHSNIVDHDRIHCRTL
jgi:Uri superfamily endonuclease